MHKAHMKSALYLARQGLGRVAPNPSVGCVIVKDGVVIARARTGDGGRPHAEEAALDGIDANGATAYVTLEPCAHRACAKKLVQAGIKHVVMACRDPDKRTSGKGVEILKAGGVEVIEGVLEDEAVEINKGFFLSKTQNRPFVTLKTATSLDGKTATSISDSKWITCEIARKKAHMIRARHDAVMVGIGTVLADDPSLTTRIDGLSHQSIKVVLDSSLQTPISSKIVSPNTWIFHKDDPNEKAGALADLGVRLFKYQSLKSTLQTLAENGITRLLVEGGARVHTSFIQCGLWDELMWFRAPIIIGGDGKNALEDIGVSFVENAPRFNCVSVERVGQCCLETYNRST